MSKVQAVMQQLREESIDLDRVEFEDKKVIIYSKRQKLPLAIFTRDEWKKGTARGRKPLAFIP